MKPTTTIPLLLISFVFTSLAAPIAQETQILSPDKHLAVAFHLNPDGAPVYSIQFNGQPALRESRLGLIRDDADFSKGLKLTSKSGPKSITDKYEILTAKRRLNNYQANREVFHLETADGK